MSKILVIDDDELFRQYLAALLERAGYQVRGLADGSGVADAIETERIDAVITDLSMPNVDGIEIVRYVKHQHPRLPIVAVTGGLLGSNDARGRVLSMLGADAVLSKPLDAESLLQMLSKTIDATPPDTPDL